MGIFSRTVNVGPNVPLELPIMTLREVVMFPHAIMPLFVGRETSVKAIEGAINNHNKSIFLVTQKEPDVEKPDPDGLFRVGVVSKILQMLRLPDGSIKVLFEGLYRADWKAGDNYDAQQEISGYPLLEINRLEEINRTGTEQEALVRAVHEAMEDYGRVNKKINQEHLASIAGLRDAGRLADSIIPHLKVEYKEKQDILEIMDAEQRLEKVFELLSGELSLASLEKSIKSRVKNQMERNQREYFLNEQIKAIHKEMGRDDDPTAEADDLAQRLKSKNMPEEAREKALREMDKLRHIPPSSAEYTVLRNYVDWVLDLPWNDLKNIDVDIAEARRMLDDAHYGLEKPKERILEYLAVQKLSGGLKGPILCLVGPPGVGKTSLAKSVAQATGREFVRVSLGGVRDEAEIRGHRRTYVGALPGKILTALKRAKFNNPLFCLDEIDKMTADFRGDPSSALLEVLDPEQNSAFSDHYLDMDYDLSQVFFITTANSLAGIPMPLLDRMEVIQLSSYLENEKVRIARNYLLPRQIEQHGIKPENIRLSDKALLEIIRSYTFESGVRSLERELAAICRKTAIQVVNGGNLLKQTSITVQNLHTFLGVKKHRYGERETNPQVGVVMGLAFNDRGGDVLYIETVLMPGSGKIGITGHLGEVMTESAKAAFSYVRSRSDQFGLRRDFHNEMDIHVHVPAGAMPKDGPSAGITLVTSIVSALLGIPVRNDIAMTGEITLRGRVMPIGGLREKLLAAKRTGINTVIIPADNKKDLTEVPDEILKSLTLHFVTNVDQVLPLALLATSEEIFPNRGKELPFTLTLREQNPSSSAERPQ